MSIPSRSIFAVRVSTKKEAPCVPEPTRWQDASVGFTSQYSVGQRFSRQPLSVLTIESLPVKFSSMLSAYCSTASLPLNKLWSSDELTLGQVCRMARSIALYLRLVCGLPCVIDVMCVSDLLLQIIDLSRIFFAGVCLDVGRWLRCDRVLHVDEIVIVALWGTVDFLEAADRKVLAIPKGCLDSGLRITFGENTRAC